MPKKEHLAPYILVRGTVLSLQVNVHQAMDNGYHLLGVPFPSGDRFEGIEDSDWAYGAEIVQAMIQTKARK